MWCNLSCSCAKRNYEFTGGVIKNPSFWYCSLQRIIFSSSFPPTHTHTHTHIHSHTNMYIHLDRSLEKQNVAKVICASLPSLGVFSSLQCSRHLSHNLLVLFPAYLLSKVERYKCTSKEPNAHWRYPKIAHKPLSIGAKKKSFFLRGAAEVGHWVNRLSPSGGEETQRDKTHPAKLQTSNSSKWSSTGGWGK